MKQSRDFRPRLKGNVLKAYNKLTSQENRILVKSTRKKEDHRNNRYKNKDHRQWDYIISVRKQVTNSIKCVSKEKIKRYFNIPFQKTRKYFIFIKPT